MEAQINEFGKIPLSSRRPRTASDPPRRSLDRDAGVGRAASVSNTVSKLIELRRRGLKYDGTLPAA